MFNKSDWELLWWAFENLSFVFLGFLALVLVVAGIWLIWTEYLEIRIWDLTRPIRRWKRNRARRANKRFLSEFLRPRVEHLRDVSATSSDKQPEEEPEGKAPD